MPAPQGMAEEPASFEHESEDLPSVGYTRLKVDAAGRILIPSEIRAAMMIKPGDAVTAEVVEGELRIVSAAIALKRVQAFARTWRAKNPGVSMVDELIADRRAEAQRELEEANVWRKSHGLPPLE